MQLVNQSALVTGIGDEGGLGFEIAKALLADGADVVLTGRDSTRGAALTTILDPSGERTRFIEADLADSAAVARLADQAGQTDILINVAATLAAGLTVDLPQEGFDTMIAVNVRAPHQLVAALAPSMIEQRRGQIINISSIGAQLASPGRAVYSMTKTALESLTRSWALEFAQYGIRVNAVAPGPMRGPKMRKMLGDEGLKGIGKSVPLGRTVGPDEVAKAVMFLISDQAAFATGSILTLDGGRLLT
jgi:NAD(P)-dependent dehydrogenase (short-subunit alcohol dehydrogenase family)